MRKIIGVWDQYKDQANTVLENRGYGPGTFSCQVREVATGNIGWACSWIMSDEELDRVVGILSEQSIPCRFGSYGDRVSFNDAIAGEGFERL